MDNTNRHPLEEAIGHRFADPRLLRTALAHPSLENPEDGDNERLEFLGDAVLGFIVAAELYRRHPEAPEGELDRMRAACVNGRSLAARGREFGLDEALQVSRAEAENNPERSDAMVENCFEAVVGALYLDAGLEAAAAFVRRALAAELEAAREGLTEQNPKGRLQEHFQALGRNLPAYELVSSEGPDHARRYTVEVRAEGRTLGRGEDRSKKSAESRAAAQALRRLEEASGEGA
jgi:ribonuclease-3